MSSFDAVSYGRHSPKSAMCLVLLANILIKLSMVALAGHIACDEKCVQGFVRKTGTRYNACKSQAMIGR